MTTRERWIIYPLLFLALSVALRDKLMRATVVDRITCRELAVVDANGNTLLRLNGDTGYTDSDVAAPPQLELASLLSIVDSEGQPLLALGRDQEGGGAMLAAFSPNRRPTVILRSNNSDVRLDLLENNGELGLMLGHRGDKSGLFAINKSGKAVPLVPVISNRKTQAGSKPNDRQKTTEPADTATPPKASP